MFGKIDCKVSNLIEGAGDFIYSDDQSVTNMLLCKPQRGRSRKQRLPGKLKNSRNTLFPKNAKFLLELNNEQFRLNVPLEFLD